MCHRPQKTQGSFSRIRSEVQAATFSWNAIQKDLSAIDPQCLWIQRLFPTSTPENVYFPQARLELGLISRVFQPSMIGFRVCHATRGPRTARVKLSWFFIHWKHILIQQSWNTAPNERRLGVGGSDFRGNCGKPIP